jgi:hypothetical protein
LRRFRGESFESRPLPHTTVAVFGSRALWLGQRLVRTTYGAFDERIESAR